jgi:hypothetical protein
MASFWKQSGGSGELRIAGVAIVAVLAFASMLNNAMAPPKPRVLTPQEREQRRTMARPDYVTYPDEGRAYADKLARESKGDFDRLPAADQQWINSVTAGRGPDMLRSRYAALKAAVTAKSKPNRKPAPR